MEISLGREGRELSDNGVYKEGDGRVVEARGDDYKG